MVIHSDDAVTPITDNCGEFGAGISVTRQPATPLSVFDGDVAAGRWTMFVYDRVGLDMGIFGSWSLELATNEQCTPDIGGDDITFVGSCGTGGCQVQISDRCSDNGKITFTCTENNLSFDETTDAIQSCIDIPESLIPTSISITDVIVSTSFQHTFVGDLESLLQKDGSLTSTLFGDPAFGCYGDGVDVTLRYIFP